MKPETLYASIKPYISVLENIDLEKIRTIADCLATVNSDGGKIILAGNGGSHAIAQHLSCDLMKGVGMNFLCCPVVNLTDNTAMLTALSNDISYEEALAAQFEGIAVGDEDVLITFSVSGTSKNIVNLLSIAERWNMSCIEVYGQASDKSCRTFPPNEEWRHIGISTGYMTGYPLHYYTCETAFSAIAHEIARLFHTRMGNYA